jgi:hypothetical protein
MVSVIKKETLLFYLNYNIIRAIRITLKIMLLAMLFWIAKIKIFDVANNQIILIILGIASWRVVSPLPIT